MNSSARRLLSRIVLYAGLTAGALLMVFPFYWMLSTAFKSTGEALTYPPVLLPDRWQPANVMTAAGIGAGLGDVLFGGWRPGAVLTYELVLRGPVEEYAAPAARVPRPRGRLRDPVGDATLVDVTELSRTVVGSTVEVSVAIRLTHVGAEPYPGVPLEVTYPRALELVRSTLPPEQSLPRLGQLTLSWPDASVGMLSYLLQNFRRAMNAAPWGRYFFNSLYIAVLSTFGTLVTGTLAAYAFARVRFRGKEGVFSIVLGSLMIPGEVLLIPSFIFLANAGWIDRYEALIIPWMASVFGIFMLRQFFMALPSDLFDAARIDGAGHLTMLRHVAIPLAIPALVTLGLFSFLGSWNALLWPLIMTNRQEMRTVQVGLQNFITDVGTDYGALMAASTLVIAPVIIGFLFVQRQFIQGIARAGLK